MVQIYCLLSATFEAEYIPITCFLKRLLERDYVSLPFWKSLLERLENFLDATGQVAYEKALEGYREKLYLSEEQWECLVSLSNGMFGERRRENIQYINSEVLRLEKILNQYVAEQKEKQKIGMPVGILGAFMLILLLL